MKKYLIFILVLITGCSYLRQHSNTARNFTFCFDNAYQGLDTMININGFFYFKHVLSPEQMTSKVEPQDTLYPIFSFYKDGFFVKDFCLECFQSPENIKRYSNGGDWGLYTVHEDTIKAQFVEPPSGSSWLKGEIWFKIIDKNTIQLLLFKYCDSITFKDILKLKSRKTDNNQLYKFAELNNKPDPNKCWLKREKWIWCNLEKYKEWKKIKY
jgi:hypothetical protein